MSLTLFMFLKAWGWVNAHWLWKTWRAFTNVFILGLHGRRYTTIHVWCTCIEASALKNSPISTVPEGRWSSHTSPDDLERRWNFPLTTGFCKHQHIHLYLTSTELCEILQSAFLYHSVHISQQPHIQTLPNFRCLMGGGHLVLLTGYITGTACRPVNFFAILISGTHCRKPFSFWLFTVIKSSIPLLSSTLPGPMTLTLRPYGVIQICLLVRQIASRQCSDVVYCYRYSVVWVVSIGLC